MGRAYVLSWALPGGRLLASNSFKGLPGLKTDPAQFLATRDAGTVVLDDNRGNRCARDLKTGKGLWQYHGANNYLSLMLSPDDRMLAVGPDFNGGPITLYEMATGRELGRLDGNRNAVRGMVFWPDGRRLAASGSDQSIRVWDIHDLARLLQRAFAEPKPSNSIHENAHAHPPVRRNVRPRKPGARSLPQPILALVHRVRRVQSAPVFVHELLSVGALNQ